MYLLSDLLLRNSSNVIGIVIGIVIGLEHHIQGFLHFLVNNRKSSKTVPLLSDKTP